MSDLNPLPMFSPKPDPSRIPDIDATDSVCPGPVMTLSKAISQIPVGSRLRITATDPGFLSDVKAWVAITGNSLVDLQTDAPPAIVATIEKTEAGLHHQDNPEHLSLILFSEELDKALAAFNIALGAVATGMQVQIFFTFWGLSLLRLPANHSQDSENPKTLEDILLGMALPKDVWHLPLSHRDLWGAGRRMLLKSMSEHNIHSVDFMLHLAKYNGVRLIACQTSMSMLGFAPADLIPGVEIGGVATMLESARLSSMNYFI